MKRYELIVKSVMPPEKPAQTFVENFLRLINDQDMEIFRIVLEIHVLFSFINFTQKISTCLNKRWTTNQAFTAFN